MRRRDLSIEGDIVVILRLKEYRAKSKLHIIMEPVWLTQSDDPKKLRRFGRRRWDKGKLGKLILH